MRKVETVTIDREGRDFGKAFVLTEMPASQAEAWATRALLAISRSTADIPEEMLTGGMASLATLTIRALSGVKWDEAKPLMDEMYTCIKIVPDPARPNVTRALIEDDIEEVSTRMLLRERILSLHLGFNIGAELSKFRQGSAPMQAGALS